MRRWSRLIGTTAVASCAVLMATTAQARIISEKGLQRSGGRLISTPYCEDNYLAQVAREYGVRHSAEAIRNNPNLKRDVCRFVGRDIRVQHNCPDEGSPRGRF